MNATDCFLAMAKDVQRCARVREVTDPTSPRKAAVTEADFALQYRLTQPIDNAVACVEFDRRWAVAYALHFFAATEYAEPLHKYNANAKKFIVDGRWEGAYGSIAVRQLRRCAGLLLEHRSTRRAVVSMGEMPEKFTVNLPCCWNFLHFQVNDSRLDMAVYQRSLNLRLMPYDLVVLSNALMFVAVDAKLPVGRVVWTVGSCHDDGKGYEAGRAQPSVVFPFDLMRDPGLCLKLLEEGESSWTGL